MTGLECLREEMERRGATKTMIESKTAAMVLDIVANAPDEICVKEQETEQRLESLRRAIERAEIELNRIKSQQETEEHKADAKLKEVMQAESRAMAYIEKFNESLTKCETAEGRDRMKIAQMFVNSVDVNTKYDNTAFIIGLSAILTQGGVNAMDEIKKINPMMVYGKKLPDVIPHMSFGSHE